MTGICYRCWLLASEQSFRGAGEPRSLGSLQSGSKLDEQCRVYFGVFKFAHDPESITDILGIQPTIAWRKGDAGPGNSKRTHDRWELCGSRYGVDSFEEQLDELLSILEGRRAQVRQVVEQFEAGICCTATYCEDANPGFHLSETLISRLASLGLSCDFDLYIIEGDDES